MSRNIAKLGMRSLESMFHRVPPATRTTGKGTNYHKSNRAKNGLFHGKDVLFGHSISHSHKLSNKKWCPNVINKRVWSDTLDNWVRFKMTTTALKAIDHSGGIDNYVMNLPERDVDDSNYVTKVRHMIGSTMFYNGSLSERLIKKLGYHKQVPPKLIPGTDFFVINDEEINDTSEEDKAHLV